MLGPKKGRLVVDGHLNGLVVTFMSCTQGRNKRKEIRFSDLSLSLYLSPFYLFFYLFNDGGKTGGTKGHKEKNPHSSATSFEGLNVIHDHQIGDILGQN